VRVLAVLAMLPLGGCSMLLGIEDPRSGGGVTATDQLMFSFGDFKLSQLQTVRLHVQLVHLDGSMRDVTGEAAYTSDDPAVVMIGEPGVASSGSQGTATIKASLGVALPATVKATVTANQCHPVINEMVTGSSASPVDEWVEIYNACTIPVDVTGWTLDYRGANVVPPTPDSTLMVTLTGSMAPGEIRLYAGAKYQGTSDAVWSDPNVNGLIGQMSGAVALRDGPKDTGALVDSLAYGVVSPMNPFIEATPAMMMSNGLSASRLPFDGKDTNDNSADFMVISTPTPRALNVP